MTNTPGITELGKIHHEVMARIKVVQGKSGCDHQSSSCASGPQLHRISSWLHAYKAWCWLTDSPVYPKQRSLTLFWKLCHSIAATTVTASTSWTSGLDFPFPYLLPLHTQGLWGYAMLTHSSCPIAVSLPV